MAITMHKIRQAHRLMTNRLGLPEGYFINGYIKLYPTDEACRTKASDDVCLRYYNYSNPTYKEVVVPIDHLLSALKTSNVMYNDEKRNHYDVLHAIEAVMDAYAKANINPV